jgi:hypothetical protein
MVCPPIPGCKSGFLTLSRFKAVSGDVNPLICYFSTGLALWSITSEPSVTVTNGLHPRCVAQIVNVILCDI